MILLAISAWISTSLVHEVTLTQLEQRFNAGKDTTFVVNFWATWCKPCVTELPAFNKLARKHAGDRVAVILVSLDSPSDKISKLEPFVKSKGYRCEVVWLNESKPHVWIDRVDSTWGGSIPATLIVRGSKRMFFEQEFTTTTLDSTLTTFMNGTP